MVSKPLIYLGITSLLFLATLMVLAQSAGVDPGTIRSQTYDFPYPTEPPPDPIYPPFHGTGISNSWPRGHYFDVSRTWPSDLHKSSVSSYVWPANHTFSFSASWLLGHSTITSHNDNWNLPPAPRPIPPYWDHILDWYWWPPNHHIDQSRTLERPDHTRSFSGRDTTHYPTTSQIWATQTPTPTRDEF